MKDSPKNPNVNIILMKYLLNSIACVTNTANENMEDIRERYISNLFWNWPSEKSVERNGHGLAQESYATTTVAL